MSANQPTSFRFPFALPEDVHSGVKDALRLTYQGVKDANDAIRALNTKVNTIQSVPAATTTPTTTQAAGGGGGGTSPSLGGVNDQTGNTAYTLQQSDFGGIVVLNTASPFALTLNSGITSPFYCVIENFGTGLATLTPDAVTALVNTAASVNLPSGQSALLFWLSPVTWWMTTLPPLAPVPLVGVSGSLGGSPMTAGQTISITVAITGATVGMVATCSPRTYPGDGFCFDAYISSANTVTVRLTCVGAATPTASLYDVRIIQ